MTLASGAAAPWFKAATPRTNGFHLSSVAGRYVLMVFLPPPGPERDAAQAVIATRHHVFADFKRIVFQVLPDAESFAQTRETAAGVHYFDDASGAIRRLYDAEGPDGGPVPHWLLLDPYMRVLATAELSQGAALIDYAAGLGEPALHAGFELPAPVLVVPRIFEPELCRALIDDYHRQGGEPSGYMIERDGKTVGVLDDFKNRRDILLEEESPLRLAARERIRRRLVPEIAKAYQFKATRIERYTVACYDASEGGYFRRHRDNTTPATAHRRFAVTINLNAEEYEGGDLRFAEFSPTRTHRAPTGGAAVFCCSVLHEVTPMVRGRRYAFLPFLYDDAGAAIREANKDLLVTGVA